ncbi:Carboxypeptidase A4 [Dinochytrium kinnereticum]|nr:Carboxypeptidase A4 [Dinochytrium kinnereticum]
MISLTKLASILVAGVTAVGCAPASTTKERYRDNKVYRFEVKSIAQANIVAGVLERYAEFDIDNWSHGVKGMVDIRIPDSVVAMVKNDLFDVLPSKILIADVQARLNEEKEFMKRTSFLLERELAAKPDAVITADQVFSDYQDTFTLLAFMKGLPGATPFTIGKSFLGDDISGIKLGCGPKSIVFHGGIHAREWISPAVTTYLANFLATDPSASILLKQFTFHIVPVLNVDGYAYTHSTDRLWRKNMQPNPNSTCLGTDPNRNWGVGWSLPGASAQPCSPAYHGASPFSAPESRAMADYILSLGNVVSYMDFHSYSQLWLFPNGHSCDQLIKDYAVVNAGGEKAVAALRAVHGTEFLNGDSCNTIYQASGTSIDWVYNVANVTYAYTAELRDTGNFGFELPADQIIPTGQEVQAAMVALWGYVSDQVYGIPSTTTTSTPTSTTSSTTTSPPSAPLTTTSVPTAVAACIHSACDTGAPLAAICDVCVGKIVAVDAYCGSMGWDMLCVRKVGSVCGVSC